MSRCFFLTAVLILAQFIGGMATVSAKTEELPVYNDWRGDNCQFKSERPFFLIKDYFDLERFWQKANIDEAIPGIDFDRFMLLVWAPGASLFDYRPVTVERLLCKDGKYIVLMDFKRKDSGGFWRRPFVATMLPLIKSGDIFIMNKSERAYGKIEYKPLYTIWDMTGNRQRPFEVAKLDPEVVPPAFVDHGKTPPVVAVAKATPAKEPSATAQASESSTAPATQTTAAAGADQPVQGQTAQTAEAAAQKPAATSGTEGIFPDDDVFGTSTGTKTETAPTPVKPAAVTPSFEEDPLFGTEFDITF